jgi:hypothetical protein
VFGIHCADEVEIRSVVLPPSGGISYIGIIVGGNGYWTAFQ